MRNLRAVYVIWYRDVLRFWRDKPRMFGALAWPLLFLLVFGGGLSGTMGLLAPGVNYSKFMFPGVIAMSVLMTSFMSGVSIVWDREFGFLKEVLVAPISRAAVTGGKTLGGATVALLQGALLFPFAPLLGVDLSPALVLKLLPLMFLMACSISALGILIASRMRSMEAFQVVMQTLVFPMIFLSGVFFPVNNLPSWMSALVKFNPATYGVDPIRQVVLGARAVAQAPLPEGVTSSPFTLTLFGHPMSILEDLAVVAAFGVVTVLLAIWSFSAQE